MHSIDIFCRVKLPGRSCVLYQVRICMSRPIDQCFWFTLFYPLTPTDRTHGEQVFIQLGSSSGRLSDTNNLNFFCRLKKELPPPQSTKTDRARYHVGRVGKRRALSTLSLFTSEQILKRNVEQFLNAWCAHEFITSYSGYLYVQYYNHDVHRGWHRT